MISFWAKLAISPERMNDPDEDFSCHSQKDWNLVKGGVKFTSTSVWSVSEQNWIQQLREKEKMRKLRERKGSEILARFLNCFHVHQLTKHYRFLFLCTYFIFLVLFSVFNNCILTVLNKKLFLHKHSTIFHLSVIL